MSKVNFIAAQSKVVAFDNNFDVNDSAYVPEVWVAESLMVLEENLVAANLVHRDFENVIQEYGDVVNTRRPGTFIAKRKTDDQDVTVQDATADKVQVKLNQHLHTSFVIKDGQMSKSFKDLVVEYLKPAVTSIAQQVDRLILGTAYEFMGNSVGQLGVDPTKETIIAANTLMSQNKVPSGPGLRNVILTPGAEGALLNISEFTKVNEVGEASALKNAILTSRFGFNFYMDQNAPSIAATQTTAKAAINNVAGYPAGTTTFMIDGTSGSPAAGMWCTIAGDMTPLRITAITSTAMTVAGGIKFPVLNDAVITIYPAAAVNVGDYSAGYSAGYISPLVIDGLSQAPLVGQMVSDGTYKYSVTDTTTPSTTTMELNRELQAALADNAQLALGPAGDYCLAIHPNAIALVSRPLALAPVSTGVQQAVANYNGLSMRVSMQYEGRGQGMLVTVDTLCGVKVLDPNLGVLIYA